MPRNLLVLALGLLFSFTACGQSKRSSPTLEANGDIDGVKIGIKYGAPSVKGREIFGKLVAYDKVWRTGANENTVITFSHDVLINGEKLPAGSYGLFTTPGKNSWKIHFNQDTDNWGAYSYKASKDVLVVESAAQSIQESVEQLRFTIISEGILLEWDKTAVKVLIQKAE